MQTTPETTHPVDFVEWLEEEMKLRGWSQAELARRSGIHTGHLSNVLSRERMPGLDFCVAIAKAFKISPLIPLKQAGLLDEDVTEDDVIDRLKRVLQGWTREERLRFLQMALLQDEMFERERRASKPARNIADEKTKYGPGSKGVKPDRS